MSLASNSATMHLTSNCFRRHLAGTKIDQPLALTKFALDVMSDSSFSPLLIRSYSGTHMRLINSDMKSIDYHVHQHRLG